jgi:hypothetical protein
MCDTIVSSKEIRKGMMIMKKIYSHSTYIKLNGEKNWMPTNIYNHYFYLEEEEAKERSFEIDEITSFEDAKEIVESGIIMNAEIGKTFFKKKPLLRFTVPKYPEMVETCTEKQFKSLGVKVVYEEERNLKIKKLAEVLSAEELCEYLRDRGIAKLF